MRRIEGRDGDPVCFGDTNVAMEVSRALDMTRFVGRIWNFRKHNSKTDGGYLVAGSSQPTTRNLVFRIDGEFVWSGVDLTKTYTLRANEGCIAAPRRKKENGEYGSTDHCRIDDW